MATEIHTNENGDTVIHPDTDTVLIDASPSENKKVYIVLSQTGTILSRILKLITKDTYNHSSIALTEDLQTMYSFGRLHPYNPFHGGFVQESPAYGTFKRFKNTKVLVLEAEISSASYSEVGQLICEMMKNKVRYHYNYWGVLLAALRIHHKKRNCYYCSEFVKAMVVQMGLPGAENIPDIVKPMHFLTVPHKTVYEGKLQEYTPAPKSAHQS
ncbi:MAG: hypothetical protein IJA91_05295 [Clostridia bacterium]|nr:hypothetical protein [Clostridia bacterium]